MNDFPEPDYAELPPPPPLPVTLEAKLTKRGIYHRDYGLLSHEKDFPYWADIDDSRLRADSYIKGNPGFDFEAIYASVDGDVLNEIAPPDRKASLMVAKTLSAITGWILAGFDVNKPAADKNAAGITLEKIALRVLAVSDKPEALLKCFHFSHNTTIAGRKLIKKRARNKMRRVRELCKVFPKAILANMTTNIALKQNEIPTSQN